MGMAVSCEAPKRVPTSELTLAIANGVAQRAEALAQLTETKLAPVLVRPLPRGENLNKDADEEEWPPLFNELRQRFKTISSALNVIDDLLSRTEL